MAEPTPDAHDGAETAAESGSAGSGASGPAAEFPEGAAGAATRAAGAAGSDGSRSAGSGPLRCDFCGAEAESVRRVALDGEYERLRTPHRVRYACAPCSARKERERDASGG